MTKRTDETDPNLTRQPSTLDSKVEIPEDAPRAMGHTDEGAEAVRAETEQHRQAVEDEREQSEVGPRAPGDHAGSDDEQADEKAQKDEQALKADEQAQKDEAKKDDGKDAEGKGQKADKKS
jgi:hypothetical protein